MQIEKDSILNCHIKKESISTFNVNINSTLLALLAWYQMRLKANPADIYMYTYTRSERPVNTCIL